MDVSNNISIKDLTNLKDLCRICLKECKTMVPLKEQLDSELNILICDCLSIFGAGKIKIDSKYPSFICLICFKLLKKFYKFRLQFIATQKLLADYFGDFFSEHSSLGTDVIKNKGCAAVELISSHGIFNLKDVIIVDNKEITSSNYDGFLKNLGSEITATFVGEKKCLSNSDKKCYKIKSTLQVQQNPSTGNGIAKCPICRKDYSIKYLKRHMQIFHSKQQTSLCDLCGLSLKTRSSHYYHMIKHFEKKHCCKSCNKKFFSSSHLRQHIEAVHLNGRLHLCSVCGKGFNYTSALTYHMRLHTGEQKYKCMYCSKKFTMSCGLKRHLVTHTGDRNYKCNLCDKALKDSSELLHHKMRHMGVRRYHCKYCQKGFIKSSNLKEHLMRHKGQHKCYICDKSFIDVEYLKFHVKKLHGID